VSWRRTGALNDSFDLVANALVLTFVDSNSWKEDGDFARDGWKWKETTWTTNYMLELVDLMLEDRQGVRSDKI
jgi:hypothetical protein